MRKRSEYLRWPAQDDIPVLGRVEGLAEGHGIRAAHVVAVLLDLVGILSDPVESTEDQTERVL